MAGPATSTTCGRSSADRKDGGGANATYSETPNISATRNNAQGQCRAHSPSRERAGCASEAENAARSPCRPNFASFLASPTPISVHRRGYTPNDSALIAGIAHSPRIATLMYAEPGARTHRQLFAVSTLSEADPHGLLGAGDTPTRKGAIVRERTPTTAS